jgi:hypothetical protein
MSRRIEKRGILKLKECLTRSEYLMPVINEDEKIPSWDGYIELYNNNNSNYKKADIIRIPVQVKSHMGTDISQENVSENIKKSDLINYSNDGGAILFVVVMKDYDAHRIYYDTLTPLKLKRYIKIMGEKSHLVYC